MQILFRHFCSLNNSRKHISTIHTKEITLVRRKAGSFHIDGDPVEKGKEIRIRVVPAGLKVLTGRSLNIEVAIRAQLIYARRKIRTHRKSIQRAILE